MPQNRSTVDRFKEAHVKLVPRRSKRRTQQKSKISYEHAGNHPSKVFEFNQPSQMPVSLITAERRQSIAKTNDDLLLNSIISFSKASTTAERQVLPLNKSATRPMAPISKNNSSSILDDHPYKQSKQLNQKNKSDPLWKNILKILYSVLGILLLAALILPSILVYIFAPRYSQTEIPETTTYANHCAGVSPNSRWKINTSVTLTMVIDTSECNFIDTPFYLVSMGGTANHFCVTGYDGVFFPTKSSFQIYVQSTCGNLSATTLLSYATTYDWNVNWVGFNK